MDNIYSWDEIYDRAIGAAFGDFELEAKDNARNQLRELIEEEEGYDIEICECPEEEIDEFLLSRAENIWFDDYGNII